MPELTPDVVARFRTLDALTPAHWRSGTTTAGDGTVLAHTDTGGDGPPLVLLHGVQVGGSTWLRTAQALESRYRVIMPDLRGHGRSGPFGDARLPATLVDDVRAVLAALDVDRPVVVGHSMGAEVAGHLAAATDLRGVVLVDPAVTDMTAAMAFDVDVPPPWMQALFDTLRALKRQPHAERMVTGLGLLPPGSGVADWHEADYVSYVDSQARFDLDLYRHVGDAAPPLVAAPDVVAAIRCPVLLLTAQPMMPGIDVEAAATAFTTHWRDGRHVHVADSGHAIAVDQFDRFIAELTAFVDGLDAQDAAASLS